MTRIPALDRVDPWRYTCPNCGSYELHTVHKAWKRADRSYSFDGHGKAAVMADRDASFRCDECSERLDAVYDKKKGREVRSV